MAVTGQQCYQMVGAMSLESRDCGFESHFGLLSSLPSPQLKSREFSMNINMQRSGYPEVPPVLLSRENSVPGLQRSVNYAGTLFSLH